MVWCKDTIAYVKQLTAADDSLIHTSTAIGKGFYNTKLMLGSCAHGAANMAATYDGGGKSDWFLPSKDELGKLFTQQTVVGGFVNSAYWSSSEIDTSNAWRQDFNPNGLPSSAGKSDLYYVRPVRAFSPFPGI